MRQGELTTRAPQIECPDCGHARSKHWNPLLQSGRDIYCRQADSIGVRYCNCSHSQDWLKRNAEAMK